jgi:hypothetical protein
MVVLFLLAYRSTAAICSVFAGAMLKVLFGTADCGEIVDEGLQAGRV